MTANNLPDLVKAIIYRLRMSAKPNQHIHNKTAENQK